MQALVAKGRRDPDGPEPYEAAAHHFLVAHKIRMSKGSRGAGADVYVPASLIRGSLGLCASNPVQARLT